MISFALRAPQTVPFRECNVVTTMAGGLSSLFFCEKPNRWPTGFEPINRTCDALSGRSAAILAGVGFCKTASQEPFAKSYIKWKLQLLRDMTGGLIPVFSGNSKIKSRQTEPKNCITEHISFKAEEWTVLCAHFERLRIHCMVRLKSKSFSWKSAVRRRPLSDFTGLWDKFLKQIRKLFGNPRGVVIELPSLASSSQYTQFDPRKCLRILYTYIYIL